MTTHFFQALEIPCDDNPFEKWACNVKAAPISILVAQGSEHRRPWNKFTRGEMNGLISNRIFAEHELLPQVERL